MRHKAAKSCEVNVDAWVHFPDGSEPGGTVEAEEWNESGSSTEAETQGIELFWLDYQADSGDITSFLVHKVGFISATFFSAFDLFSLKFSSCCCL